MDKTVPGGGAKVSQRAGEVGPKTGQTEERLYLGGQQPLNTPSLRCACACVFDTFVVRMHRCSSETERGCVFRNPKDVHICPCCACIFEG